MRRCGDRYQVLLVLVGGLLGERRQFSPRAIGVIGEKAGDRRAIDVNVEHGHEDRDPPRRAGRRLRRGADRKNRTVGGGNDGVRPVCRMPFRVAEEGDQERGRDGQGESPDRMAGGGRRDRQGEGGKDELPSLAGQRKLQWGTPSRWFRAIASMRSFRASFSFFKRFSSISSS
jgi:hypothetical protein